MLTETAVSVPRAYRPARRVSFADVDRLRMERHRGIEQLVIRAPGAKTSLNKVMFRSVAEFDHVVTAVAERVALRGGPSVVGNWPLPPR